MNAKSPQYDAMFRTPVCRYDPLETRRLGRKKLSPIVLSPSESLEVRRRRDINQGAMAEKRALVVRRRQSLLSRSLDSLEEAVAQRNRELMRTKKRKERRNLYIAAEAIAIIIRFLRHFVSRRRRRKLMRRRTVAVYILVRNLRIFVEIGRHRRAMVEIRARSAALREEWLRAYVETLRASLAVWLQSRARGTISRKRVNGMRVELANAAAAESAAARRREIAEAKKKKKGVRYNPSKPRTKI